MTDAIQRATLFALYQLSIIAGIALMPVALLARRGGVVLPVGPLLERLGRAYEDAAGASS